MTEVVVVAGVQVPGALGRLLVIQHQLEDRQCVVDPGHEDQIEEQIRAELQKIGEIFGIVVKHGHVDQRDFFSEERKYIFKIVLVSNKLCSNLLDLLSFSCFVSTVINFLTKVFFPPSTTVPADSEAFETKRALKIIKFKNKQI